ncbi:hypothetical protein O3Q51_07135 [Cryomorphaceae bacterium 1068]|nr:hypothetical protein [Cryomorphaceae bacterium 1068]
MIERLTYLAGHLCFIQAPLDRDTWLDDKEGMDFNEPPPELPEFDTGVPMAPTADWVVLFRYFAIVVLAALLVFVIVRLISRKRAKSAHKEENVAEVDSTEEGPTALSPLEELWSAYNKAKNEKDFREAVRILYQIIIKHLDSQGKLKAAADKTNREYTREMTWKEKAPDFFQLTLLHEFSWYGANEVKQGDFDRAEPRFLEFIESIKNG